MSEVVIQTGRNYDTLQEPFANATTWLHEEMGFNRIAHKMVPSIDRWEMLLCGVEDSNYARAEEFYSAVHPWLKNFMWEQHVDEFYAETGCTMERSELFYMLLQSGDGWKRWYCIFGQQEPDALYYLATVFDKLEDAILYRLSV